MTSYSTNMQYRRAPAASSTAVAEAPGIFQRTMQWRNKRDAKITKLRNDKMAERAGSGVGMAFDAVYQDTNATVGEHLDAFHRYNMLVGEADGGVPLAEHVYKKL